MIEQKFYIYLSREIIRIFTYMCEYFEKKVAPSINTTVFNACSQVKVKDVTVMLIINHVLSVSLYQNQWTAPVRGRSGLPNKSK